MAHRVIWSPAAIADLRAIAAYIGADSPKYAAAVVGRIINATRTLARFPRLGRKVPEFDEDHIRELIVYSYRIIYVIDSEQLTIAAVVHGRRML